ncbi:hypothetical protein, partial [Kineococcus glutinatus]|uniref:hypothetical protein n=1 Tax=Kineococcus glutinatus TaxID=1070872 RepID=UPI0031E8CCC8
RARRRRRVARTSALTTAVLLAGAGTASAGEYLATRTGQHATGWHVQAAGAGEGLDVRGSDHVEVVRELIADIPYAPGYEHLREAEPVTGSLRDTTPPGEGGTVISESAARAQAAQNAVCTWADAWIAADTRGDRAARDTATAALAGSLAWPAVRDVDPDPSATGHAGDQGVGTPTRFGWVPALIAATGGGQHQAVLDAVTGSGRCRPAYTPAMNADPGYAGPGR